MSRVKTIVPSSGWEFWKTYSAVNIEQRREVVGKLYLQGFPQGVIADQLGVSQPTVSLDLSAVRDDWAKSAASNVGERLAVELAKIDEVEAVAWEEFRRSQEDGEVESTRTEAVPLISPQEAPSGKGRKGKRKREELDNGMFPPDTPGYTEAPMVTLKTTTEKRRVARLGDERFLGRVAWCIEMRSKLLGLLKPDTAKTTTIVQINWQDMMAHGSAQGPILDDSPDPLEEVISRVGPGRPPKQLGGVE